MIYSEEDFRRFDHCSPSELLSLISAYRQRISQSWWTEDRIKQRIRPDVWETAQRVHDYESYRALRALALDLDDREKGLLDQVRRLWEHRRSDEDCLLDCMYRLRVRYGQRPSPWEHPGVEDLRAQVLARIRPLWASLPVGRRLRRYWQVRKWLARIMSTPVEDCQVEKFSWLECHIALNQLDRRPFPVLVRGNQHPEGPPPPSGLPSPLVHVAAGG